MSKKPLIFTLIASEDWTKLRKLLRTAKGARLCREKDNSGLNCLGMALGYQAPDAIIEKFIEICPDLLNDKDVFGATCLHVAALNGTRCGLIEILLRHRPALAETIDFDLRGALHHATEFAVQAGVREEPYYFDVIRLLCSVAPTMVHCIDKSGETPIDLVHFVKSNTSPTSDEYKRLQTLYLFLRSVSISVYSENKKRWELEGYLQNLTITGQELESGSQPSAATSTTGSFSHVTSVLTSASMNVSMIMESPPSEVSEKSPIDVVQEAAKRRRFRRTSSTSSA